MLGKIRWSAVALASALLAGAMTIWACASLPISAEARGRFGEFEFTIGVNQGTHDPVVEVTGPASCLRVTYVGADGGNIATRILTVPNADQVPPGTVRADYAIVDCPDAAPQTNPPQPGVTPLAGSRSSEFGVWREVFSIPLTMNPGSVRSTIFHARVLCGQNQDPLTMIQPILAAGPGTAVPTQVDILYFAELVPTASGATIRSAVRSPIVNLRLDWNGTDGFSDLATGANATPFTLANGWSAVDSYIDDSDVDTSIGGWNRADVTIKTLAHPDPEHYSIEYHALKY